MGLTREQIHHRSLALQPAGTKLPLHISLMRQAQAVKRGCGCPRYGARVLHHHVTDGIAMGHAGMKSSLPSREVIADSIELTVRALL